MSATPCLNGVTHCGVMSYVRATRNVGGLPRDKSGLPHDVSELPRDESDVPHDDRHVPHDDSDVPRIEGELPHDMGESPHDIGDFPTTMVNLRTMQVSVPATELRLPTARVSRALGRVCLLTRVISCEPQGCGSPTWRSVLRHGVRPRGRAAGLHMRGTVAVKGATRSGDSGSLGRTPLQFQETPLFREWHAREPDAPGSGHAEVVARVNAAAPCRVIQPGFHAERHVFC
jgi:hypothetical protein